MRYRALATDFDGTLAHDGKVESSTIAALQRLRGSGRRLIMVTGRELDELLAVFDGCKLFDRIVVENGALLYQPANGTSRTLAPPPPRQLVEALGKKGVPFSVGRSILATVEPHEHAVLDAIRDLGLEWHVIFNKGSVMALPAGVTKATGLTPALEELGISAGQTVAVGDAENDHAFMRLCGVSAAVANALDSVKSDADFTTEGARGAGVAELIDRIIANDLADVIPKASAHREAR
jgi:hypothetical protein